MKIIRHMATISFYVLCAGILVPGMAFLSVYGSPDVRRKASEWIYSNIPENAYILSETANVVDIPFPTEDRDGVTFEEKNYKVISFNFYDIDDNPLLASELEKHLLLADYIFVPSRRIFANHTCLKDPDRRDETITEFALAKVLDGDRRIESVLSGYYPDRCKRLDGMYPKLKRYYETLFDGSSGFEKVAEFNSFPGLNLFGLRAEFPDENAEETWTVFDHPVIRIYKRKNSAIRLINGELRP